MSTWTIERISGSTLNELQRVLIGGLFVCERKGRECANAVRLKITFPKYGQKRKVNYSRDSI